MNARTSRLLKGRTEPAEAPPRRPRGGPGWRLASFAALLIGCQSPSVPEHPVEPPDSATYAGSSACGGCHRAAQAEWEQSAHARSERLLGEAERSALARLPGSTSSPAGVSLPVPTDVEPDGRGEVTSVIGVTPLWQPLVELSDGRVQVYDQAWDTAAELWFQVVEPAPAPGTAAHWTGRQMIWNSQCAPCHDTGVRIGWSADSDRYATTFVERGVGCEACHGPAAGHAANPSVRVPVAAPGFSTCAPCHSRRAALTESVHAGDRYLDGYVPLLMDDAELYWPDGQVRAEVFEATSFLGSRMHQVGVRCTDCHAAHNGATVRAGDALCLGCHSALPGFQAHDHHPPESPGARCVACHMPTTVFMQRQPRHDHGFTIPDPRLGVSEGVPDACTRCHTDHDAAWAAEVVTTWYGSELRPSQQRARILAEGGPGLLGVARSDPHPFWRATAMGLLGKWVEEGQVASALFDGARDADELVRLEAIGALAARGDEPAVADALRRALTDPVRGVRVEALRGLRRGIHPGAAEGAELRAYLELNGDQPTASLELGTWWLERGDAAAAWPLVQRATTWDPEHAQARLTLAFTALRLGRPEDARSALQAATRLAPTLVEGWLALALVLQEQGDTPAAIKTLERGELAAPASPRLPEARATLLRNLGRTEEADDAAARARRIALSSPSGAPGATSPASGGGERPRDVEPLNIPAKR